MRYLWTAEQAPLFLAGDLALDFINTTYGDEHDCLLTDAHVLAWLDEAGALPAHEKPISAPGLRDIARTFRSEARLLVEQRLANDWADPAPLNRMLAKGLQHSALSWVRGSTPELRVVQEADDPATLLLPVAQALASLLAQPDISRFRACAGDGCTLLFHDSTRGGRRRWCDMAQCGNRAKVNSYRDRRKTFPLDA